MARNVISVTQKPLGAIKRPPLQQVKAAMRKATNPNLNLNIIWVILTAVKITSLRKSADHALDTSHQKRPGVHQNLLVRTVRTSAHNDRQQLARSEAIRKASLGHPNHHKVNDTVETGVLRSLIRQNLRHLAARMGINRIMQIQMPEHLVQVGGLK